MVYREVRVKRKWRSSEECEPSRSEFFCTNTEDWGTSIHKRIARMSSELWIIGDKFSIYKSLRRRAILKQSLCWDVLQNHSWRRRWFCRSNPSIPRVFTTSCRQRFQSFCHNPRKKQQLDQLFKFIFCRFVALMDLKFRFHHRQTQIEILGGGMPREESYRGSLASPNFRTQSHQVWIGAILHQGNSSDAIQDSDKSSAIHKRSRSHLGKEVGWYSCLLILWGKSLQAEISKLVMRMVRQYDQDERETNRAIQLNSVCPQSRGKHVRSQEDGNSRIRIGFDCEESVYRQTSPLVTDAPTSAWLKCERLKSMSWNIHAHKNSTW